MKAESQEKAYNGNKFHGRILEDKETVLLSIRSTENENQEKIDIRIDNENARNGLSPNIRLHTFAYCCVTHTHTFSRCFFLVRYLSLENEIYMFYFVRMFLGLSFKVVGFFLRPDFHLCWPFYCFMSFICLCLDINVCLVAFFFFWL